MLVTLVGNMCSVHDLYECVLKTACLTFIEVNCFVILRKLKLTCPLIKLCLKV